MAPAAALPYPVLSDVSLTTIDHFGVRHEDEPKCRRIARPPVFVIDSGGAVRYARVGEHERDRPALGGNLLALGSLDK